MLSKPTNTKQELHRALRRAMGCFAVGDPRSDGDPKLFPKWVKYAEKTLKALRAEEGTED
jgi:hypothetical protein